MINKICKVCQKEFIVGDDDLEFYKKISPKFGEHAVEIPAPTLCPDCRICRRFAFRNERKLYSNNCAFCQKPIVTIYAQNSEYIPYCMDCWFSDKWDAGELAQDYDSSRPFMEQFKELMHRVPRLAVMSPNNENCDYTNGAEGNKDCYLIFVSDHNQNCAYCEKIFSCTDVFDSTDCEKCEYSYSLNGCTGCSRSKFLIDCHNTNDSMFCFDCKGCHDCFMCTGLRQKEYCIENKPYSKEVYEQKLKDYYDSSQKSVDQNWQKLLAMKKDSVHLYMHGNKNENCSGDYISNCKDSKQCFESHYLENGKFSIAGNRSKDIYDCYVPVDNSELVYESVSMIGLVSSAFTFGCWDSCRNVYYSEYLRGCRNCFGCSGLNKKEFCILNKQYSEAEYNELVPKIIESMKAGSSWGEYFPVSLSPFGYNETASSEYYPKSKDEALKIGANWQDNDYASSFSGEFYIPKEKIDDYIGSKEETEKLLAGALKCSVSGRPFKVTRQELSFYMKAMIPIPTKHYDVRYAERLALRNARNIYERECMCEEVGHDHASKCTTKVETTYAPDRVERIYCEKCYQQSVN